MKKLIKAFIWPAGIIEKCFAKHDVVPNEAEAAFSNSPKFKRWENGDVEGEDFYQCLGKTDEGRFLTIFFIFKKTGEALIISARDMDPKEKRRYGKKKD